MISTIRHIPVSYTHLDVYKRQVESDKEHPFIVKTKQLTVEATGTAFNVNAYAPDHVAAVSYTHLDVYKRQIYLILLFQERILQICLH